jgi:hypothetical protein
MHPFKEIRPGGKDLQLAYWGCAILKHLLRIEILDRSDFTADPVSRVSVLVVLRQFHMVTAGRRQQRDSQATEAGRLDRAAAMRQDSYMG